MNERERRGRKRRGIGELMKIQEPHGKAQPCPTVYKSCSPYFRVDVPDGHLHCIKCHKTRPRIDFAVTVIRTYGDVFGFRKMLCVDCEPPFDARPTRVGTGTVERVVMPPNQADFA